MFTLIIIWILILTVAIIGTAIITNQKQIIVFPETYLIVKIETRSKKQEPRSKSQEPRNRSQEWNTISRIYKQSSIAIAGLAH